MQSRVLILFLSFYLCSTVLGNERQVQSFVESEVNEMLKDEKAFPQDSRQHDKLLRFQERLSRMLADKNKSPTENLQQDERKTGSNVNIEMPRHPNYADVNYTDIMSRYVELEDELNNAKQLLSELTQDSDVLKGQLEELKKYQNNKNDETNTIKSNQEYKEALISYKQGMQHHADLLGKYKNASVLYKANQQEYRQMLSDYRNKKKLVINEESNGINHRSVSSD